MASSIVVRAKEYMERQKNRAKSAARENQTTYALIANGATSTAVTVGLAFADQKMGAGKQWKVGPIPVGALGGLGMLVPAFFLRKYPIAQAALVGGGMSALNISGYRYLVEEVIEAGT